MVKKMHLENEFVNLAKAFQEKEEAALDISLSGNSQASSKLPYLFEQYKWEVFETINYRFEKWDGKEVYSTDRELKMLIDKGYLPFARCNNTNFFDAVCLSMDQLNGPVYRLDHERKDLSNIENKYIEFDSFKAFLKHEIQSMQDYLNQAPNVAETW